MSLLGDTLDIDALEGTQDPTRHNDVYIRCIIPEALRDKVLFYKTEPVDGGVSDTYHDPGYPWVIENTSLREGSEAAYRTMNTTKGGLVSQGLPQDAGLIIRFHGKPVGQIALDLNTAREYTEVEALAAEEQFGISLPRYTRWGFTIHSIIKTDGPERRQRLFETVEQQRSRSNTEMQDSFKGMFVEVIKMIQSMQNGQTVTPSPAVQKMISEQPEIDPLQAAAIAEAEAANNDNVGNDGDAGEVDVKAGGEKK